MYRGRYIIAYCIKMHLYLYIYIYCRYNRCTTTTILPITCARVSPLYIYTRYTESLYTIRKYVYNKMRFGRRPRDTCCLSRGARRMTREIVADYHKVVSRRLIVARGKKLPSSHQSINKKNIILSYYPNRGII